MDPLQHFSLPILGMKNGNHVFHFELDHEFFKTFDNTIIQEGNFTAEVQVDKRSNLMILSSEIKGFMETQCDRCLSGISLPLQAKSTIHVKYGRPEESDDEVMFIEEESTKLQLADWLYETVVVSVPLIKVYDCNKEIPRPCNDEILKILNNNPPDEDDDTTGNLFKNIQF